MRTLPWILLIGAVALSQPAMAEMSESISVVVDRATVMAAPEGTTTLIVGNPAIADTSIQRNNVVVLTGKSYGTTNIIALDSSGKAIKEMTVNVRSPHDHILTVHRGIDRESYSCAPVCERTLRVGDAQTYFDQVGSQFGARNSIAQSQAGQSR